MSNSTMSDFDNDNIWDDIDEIDIYPTRKSPPNY